MKNRTFLIIAMLVSSGACSDDAVDPPDPADAAPVDPDAMAGEPDAANPVDAAPEPDAGVEPVLTLVGTVSVGDTEVEALVGVDTVATTTADSTGNYRLDIVAGDTDLIHLRANNGAALILTSVLADVATLTTRAGADEELTADEYSATNISPVSTLRYSALRAANGDAVPASYDELVNAEQLMTSVATGHELLEMAAALNLIISSPSYTLPVAYADTLALAENLHAMRQLVADIHMTGPGDIGTSLAVMMIDADIVGQYAASKLASAYHFGIIKHNNGFVGNGQTSLEVDAGGTARLLESDTARLVQAPFEFIWSIGPGPDGARLITDREANGVRTISPFVDADTLAGLYSGNPTLQAQIQAALGTDQIQVVRERIGSEHVLAAEGISVDLVWVTDRWFWQTSSALAAYGVTANDVEGPTQGFGTAMARSDYVVYEPLDQATVLGTWAMQVVAPADRDSLLGAFVAGDDLMSHSLVTFAPDNTATAMGGLLGSPLMLTWQLLADGRLELTYPDGARQIVGLWVQQGPEYGLLSRYLAPTGEMHMSYWRAIKTDPAFTLAGPELYNQVGQFWKTTISIYSYFVDENGNLPVFGEFGFTFRANGTADNISVSGGFDGLPPDLNVNDAYDWRLDSGELILNWTTDPNGQYHCDLSNSNCYALRERVWTPLAQEGPYLYVLEDYSVQAGYFQLQWDPVDMQWEVNGVPADLTAREYLFTARVNAYFIADIPAI